MYLKKTEFAQQARKNIALAKQKILSGQAAKTKSHRRHKTISLCITKILYKQL